MHTTGTPPESHDCNINYTGIQRQYYEKKNDVSRIQFTLCRSLPGKNTSLLF